MFGIGPGECHQGCSEASRVFAGVAATLTADRDPILARVLPGEAEFTRTFWMSMPAEAKHLARMQAVWSFLKEVGQGESGRLRPDRR